MHARILIFYLGFQFRFRDAGAGAAARSAAAHVLPFDEESQQAAAANVGLEEHARAAGAETDLLDVRAVVEVNALHAAPNSDGMEKVFGLHTIVLGDNGASGVAATELPAAPITDGLGDFF